MIILTECVYIKSKSIRDNQVASLSDERAEAILNKVKSLYFALWKGEGIATTEEMADFYEVEAATIRQVFGRHKEELASDGVKSIRGKPLKEVRDLVSLSSSQSRITIWTPRAALRLGMLLRNSEVATEVRTSVLKAVEEVIPAQTQELERLRLENQNLHLQVEVAKAQRGAAEAQERLMAASSALAIINPALPALVLGRPDAIVTQKEVIEKTVLVNSKGKAISTYEGLSKTKSAQRFGMKKARYFVDWLWSIGKEDVLESGLTAAPCQYVPWSKVAELEKLWASRRGTRQFLIGE